MSSKWSFIPPSSYPLFDLPCWGAYVISWPVDLVLHWDGSLQLRLLRVDVAYVVVVELP